MARKTGREARAERMTWFAMVLVFMLLNFDRDLTIPDFVIPFLLAAILLVSGVYQYTQNWRVSPLTWIFFAVFVIGGIFGVYYNSPIDLRLASLVMVVIIIAIGVITNEG